MQTLSPKIEEMRQASRIHGGVMRMCVAALGVKLSRVKIPSRRLRMLVYRTVYGKKYNALNEADFEQPIWAYPSLNALFTRGVKPELRPIPQESDQFLCPCDGTIQEVCRLDNDRIVTVKCIEYSMSSLLPNVDTSPFINGHYAIIFLHPSDCHRIFSPQEGQIEEVVHVPGYRLLVHPPYQKKEYPVFSLNERVIIRMATPLGKCVLVLVAGWGVGNITLRFAPQFRPQRRKLTRTNLTPAFHVNKGEWLATFELGSTAILITEPNERVVTHVTPDQKVKYGEPAFSFTH